LNAATGEFIGISKIINQDLDAFKTILNGIIDDNRKQYYDFAFQQLSYVKNVSFIFTSNLKWTEVDTNDDLTSAQKIAEEIDRD
jgi:choline kinase